MSGKRLRKIYGSGDLILDQMTLPTGSLLVADRAYLDFRQNSHAVGFVLRVLGTIRLCLSAGIAPFWTKLVWWLTRW